MHNLLLWLPRKAFPTVRFRVRLTGSSSAVSSRLTTATNVAVVVTLLPNGKAPLSSGLVPPLS